MGDAPTTPADAQADDLFGRWLAHRARNTNDVKVDGGAPQAKEQPAPTGASGVRGDDVRELDRLPPAGFEPVLIRSVRKKEEAKQQEPDRGKRRLGLRRGRDEPAGPAPQNALEPTRTPSARPSAITPEPGPDVPPLPQPEPVVPPNPEPDPVVPPNPDPDPVVPEPEPAPPPAPEPEPDTEPRGSAVEAFRNFVEPLAPPEPIEPFESATAVMREPVIVAPKRARAPKRPRERAPKRVAPVADVLVEDVPVADVPVADVLVEDVLIEDVPVEDVPVEDVPVEDVLHEGAPEAAPDRSSYAPLPSTAPQMPAVYQFTPRKSSRRILNALLLTGLAGTGWFGYTAWQFRDEVTIGVAAIVGLTTLVVWGIRAGAAPTTLTVRNGQLEVRRSGSRFVFDLASTYTPIEVVGEPRRRGWKVLFLRRGMPPFKVDATMVDPHEFMRVLRFFRPERPR